MLLVKHFKSNLHVSVLCVLYWYYLVTDCKTRKALPLLFYNLAAFVPDL